MSVAVSREERQVEARRLRAQGQTYRQIADALGVSTSTVCRWVNPDYAERDRARSRALKQRYRGVCATCGASTSGSGGPGTASREYKDCMAERPRRDRYWTADRIILAIQRWAREHGKPPIATDWLHAGPYWPRSRRSLPAPADRRRIREAAGVSLRDVAAAIGVSHTAVASWEAGATPRAHRAAYAKLLHELSRLRAEV